MADILHLLTRPDDAFAAEMMARQKAAGHDVAAVDLTVAEPDYQDIVKKIFQADSIQT
jgi:hypothetical protein